MATRRHYTHPHPLTYVPNPYTSKEGSGWKCDKCAKTGSTYVWHCQPCSYDLCDTCINSFTNPQAPRDNIVFNIGELNTRVNAAMARVRQILENHRTPAYAAEVHHEYEDKYLLAEFIGNTTISSILQALEAIGLNDKIFQQLKEWSKKRSVTLRLKADEACKFLRKTTREVESDTRSVNTSTLFGKTESYTLTKVHEWFWQFDARYELIAYMGNEPEKGVVLTSRAATLELKTTTETTPRPASVVKPGVDVNITWLLNQLSDTRVPQFAINRQAKSCHTPRRNQEVEDAFSFFTPLFSWCRLVHTYFSVNLWPLQTEHGLDLAAIRDAGVFVPAIPLFDESLKSSGTKTGSGSGVVPLAYIEGFLGEQKRGINAKFAELNQVMPNDQKLITAQEARLLFVMLHVQHLCTAFGDGVDYIEHMIFRQLVAAIGKEVQPLDFANYMRYHSRKLFKHDYQPTPFSYAIRRVGHDPEGTLSIEARPSDGSITEPIATIVRHTSNARPMKFALDASTEVRFGGDRFLHGYVMYQFGGESGVSLSMRALARQFSSYIVLIGAIASADLFVPKYGMIVQNKDEFTIPLDMETIPTPKEFRDAIESLSPEQQRFAKAFRSMQLESTLFGVCVIQIKPQLERLLKLPPDALTKEIQLAQDLQTLFIEYQMPSDLLSFDGPENTPVASKVSRVKELCGAMMATINKEKDEQMREARLREEMRRAAQEAEERKQREEAERRHAQEEQARRRDESVMYESVSLSAPQRSGSSGFLGAVSGALSRAVSPRSSSSAAPAKMMMMGSAPSPVAAAPAAAVSASAPASSTPVAPAAAPADVSKKPAEPAKEQPKEKQQAVAVAEGEDFTKVPQELEVKYETLDEDSALRPTIIKAGNTWSKRSQKTLLSATEQRTLGKDEQGKERNRAFDLLDALTKSGAMPIAEVDLHVLIAATHCFAKSVMNTVVQDNINPIEKVERSALIIGTSIHRSPAVQLVREEQAPRVAQYSPKLIDAAQLASIAVPQLSSNALQPVAK